MGGNQEWIYDPEVTFNILICCTGYYNTFIHRRKQ